MGRPCYDLCSKIKANAILHSKTLVILHVYAKIPAFLRVWGDSVSMSGRICRYSEKYGENKDIRKSAWKRLVVPCGRAGSASNNQDDQDILARGPFGKLVRASRSVSR